MRSVVRLIDFIGEWTGKVGCWFSVALVLLINYKVVMRYVFRAPELWPFEVNIMLGASLFALAFSYTHFQRAHVRSDVIYTHFSNRGKAIIDVIGGLLICLPFTILLASTAWEWMWHAWATDETMPFTGWSPPAGPLRTMVMLGLALLALQGVSQLIQSLHLLIRNERLDQAC